MRPDDILQFLNRRPFEPVRVTLTDGRSYEIHHPELAMVGRSSMAIGVPAAEETEPVYDRLVTVSLLHIMQVEPVDGSTATS